VFDSWLREVVFTHRLELWVTVSNMMLCLDGDLNCG